MIAHDPHMKNLAKSGELVPQIVAGNIGGQVLLISTVRQRSYLDDKITIVDQTGVAARSRTALGRGLNQLAWRVLNDGAIVGYNASRNLLPSLFAAALVAVAA